MEFRVWRLMERSMTRSRGAFKARVGDLDLTLTVRSSYREVELGAITVIQHAGEDASDQSLVAAVASHLWTSLSMHAFKSLGSMPSRAFAELARRATEARGFSEAQDRERLLDRHLMRLIACVRAGLLTEGEAQERQQLAYAKTRRELLQAILDLLIASR